LALRGSSVSYIEEANCRLSFELPLKLKVGTGMGFERIFQVNTVHARHDILGIKRQKLYISFLLITEWAPQALISIRDIAEFLTL
ncbi:hypothetical protein BaRGS_00012301, partial [Batillaria attramentaria]